MSSKHKFYIVAIGFSAGGRESLNAFFSNIPDNPGVAFIIVQHLGRDYQSAADRLLAPHTDIPIHWAEDHLLVEPDNIYILPNNRFMTIKDGYLELYERDPLDRSNWAVDIFFHSLADDLKSMGIGVILSGIGSDGTQGALHMYQQDGTIMVQDPETAAFESMPLSVIKKDHPVEIRSPARLASALMDFVNKEHIE